MADGPLIIRIADHPGVDRGNGIRSFPLVGGDTGADRLLTGMTVIPVGASIPRHTHSSEEFILILEGEAVCEVADATHRLGRLDSTYVPAGLEHRFLNVGDTPLRILWVYSDIHTTRTLVETGETLGHLESYPGSP
jgi:quercetin dioxygenase-like cupin family protein